MIPKVIHYCWFGRGQMSELAQSCIDSWHKNLPDYEFKLWNEDNFDINSNQYVKEAYESRKYAFVTDYVRLFALFTEGGIYMDTDVEVLKPYDDLLHLKAFTGYEGSKHLPPITGTMASEAGGEWVKELLDDYNDIHFILPNGTMDLMPNTQRIAATMEKNGFICDGTHRVYKDAHIFPVDYFCPRQTSYEFLLTENTYCDHKFMGSWKGAKKKKAIAHILGSKLTSKLIKLKRRIIG